MLEADKAGHNIPEGDRNHIKCDTKGEKDIQSQS